MTLRAFAIATAVLLAATEARAVVDAQILVGQGDMKGDAAVGISGLQEVTFAAHVGPFGVIPIAVGGFASSRAFTLLPEGDEGIRGKMSGIVYGPEALARLRFGPVSPYLKGSVLLGTYLYTVDEEIRDVVGTHSVEGEARHRAIGYKGSVGLTYHPLPTVGLVLEYAIGEETHSNESASFTLTSPDGTRETYANPAGADRKVQTRMLLLGMEVGI